MSARKRKTGYGYGRKVFVFERRKHQARIYPPLVWVHAMPSGAPVLKDLGLPWWRTVNGVLVSGRIWRFQFQFRRFWQ